jgi:uncharacterized membrane protein YhaH (DUF805 family)
MIRQALFRNDLSMQETGLYPAVTASIGGKQRRLTLARQWRRAIENGEIDRATPVHYEPGPGQGRLIEAKDCPELAALLDEIKGPVAAPLPPPADDLAPPRFDETQAELLARLEAEVAAAPPAQRFGPLTTGPALDIRPDDMVPGRSAPRPQDLSGVQWALKALGNYAKFGGRARRSEYWYFQLFVTLPLLILMVIFIATDSASLFAVSFLVSLLLVIPGIAVTVRRVHDRGLSGWYVPACALATLIPIVGVLILIGFFVLLALPGVPRANQYGADPKG